MANSNITTIVAQRIIRTKGSKVAVNVGGVFTFGSVTDLIAHAKKQRKVFTFIDSEGNEGTIRSGRRMRRCDSHVRNTVSSMK